MNYLKIIVYMWNRNSHECKGYVVSGFFHNRFNYNRKWFQEKKFEKHLYELLRVKKWKEIKWLCMEQRYEFEYAKALY